MLFQPGFPIFFTSGLVLPFYEIEDILTCTFSVLSRHFYQLFGHGNNFPYWETLLIFCNKIFYCICRELHSQKSGRKSYLKTAQNWVCAINTILPKFFLHQVVSFKPSPSPRVEEVKPFVTITRVFTCQDCLKGPKNPKLLGAFHIIFTCQEDYLKGQKNLGSFSQKCPNIRQKIVKGCQPFFQTCSQASRLHQFETTHPIHPLTD